MADVPKYSLDLELEKYRDVPSIFTNRFIVQSYGDVVRISFGDVVLPGTTAEGRASIILRFADAFALAETLQRTLSALPNPPSQESNK